MMIYGIIIWLIGAIFTYGRFTGSFYEVNDYLKPDSIIFNVSVAFCSWIVFIPGIFIYFGFIEGTREKYFFKWSYRKLHKRYIKHLHNRNVGIPNASTVPFYVEYENLPLQIEQTKVSEPDLKL